MGFGCFVELHAENGALGQPPIYSETRFSCAMPRSCLPERAKVNSVSNGTRGQHTGLPSLTSLSETTTYRGLFLRKDPVSLIHSSLALGSFSQRKLGWATGQCVSSLDHPATVGDSCHPRHHTPDRHRPRISKLELLGSPRNVPLLAGTSYKAALALTTR
jgi:hypothetical protein